VWRVRDENIGPEQIVDPGGMICFAAKWVGEKEVEFRSDHHDGHKRMVRRAHRLLDEADVVLHFNGRRFDVPHIQREFVELGLLPPSPFKQIDLLETVKRQFRFLTNRLAHVAPQLGLAGKEEHEGFGLWLKCMGRDRDAWERMRSYNIRDTLLLEEAYGLLRPWIMSHPSRAAFAGMDVCPRCGAGALQWRGYAVTATGSYRRFQCKGCGGWGRSTVREGKTRLTQIV
jgi:hypothetical protein